MTTTPRLIELRHPEGLALTLMDVGATWLSCRVPLADGTPREVLLGCPRPEDYAHQTAFLGATIGRYANRIGGARITRGGRAWALQPNPGSPHQLHGGPDGFDKRCWDVLACSDTEARFGIVSPDGDQGCPGRLEAKVTWRINGPREIEIEFEAQVDAACPVGLTSHAYFNLDARHDDVRGHRLQVAAERYLPVDAALIPLGALAEVAGTSFDFRHPKPLAQDWLGDAQQRAGGGYDHAFLLDPACAAMRSPAAVLEAADASLRLSLFTTLPALQLYAGQYLAGIPDRGGTPYPACAGAALEPEFLPDSPNHPEWPQPDCWLQPGQVFRHRIRYAFDASRGTGSSSRRDSSALP